MSEPQPAAAGRPQRDEAERAADHAAIERLAVELLPALMAKLGATGLGELEVREGGWRVRLRRPLDGAAPAAPAPTARDRAAERRRGSGSGDDRAVGERGSGDRPLRSAHHPLETISARTDSRTIATSPAVGIYRPRTDLTVGDRVRAGDRLGAVDMLGVAQEVVAPTDGIVGSSLVESGDAVEYGQELLAIEMLPAAGASTNGTS